MTALKLSLQLRPPVLDDLGLPAALDWTFERFRDQFDLRIDFEREAVDESSLDDASPTGGGIERR